MPTLLFTTDILAPVEELFLFHTDTNNLELITPLEISVGIESIVGEGKGSIITLRMRALGLIRSRWVIEIAEFEPPHRIVDLQLSGPFKFFRHSRTFTSLGEDTSRLEDMLEYELPLGIIGRIANALFFRGLISRQFAYRHKQTHAILDQYEDEVIEELQEH
ncbi:MAG: SRPBCC family protein [Candidatus Kapaibacterium sp.]|jgi:ligand-binding SRPBCC domain-containing protein